MNIVKRNIKILKAFSMQVDKATKVHTVNSKVAKSFGLYLFDEWKTLADKVLEKADETKQTKASVNSLIKFADETMGEFASIVESEVNDHVEYFYKYSKNKFIKAKDLKLVEKALPEISPAIWTDADVEAIKQLKRLVNGATGNFYKNSVQTTIADSVRANMFESDLTPTEAIDVMKSDLAKALKVSPGSLESDVVPIGFRGTADAYFKGMAEYTATMARTSSQVYSMGQVDAKYMVVYSLRSPRTCIGCLAMDGKRFKVSDAVAHVDNMLSVDDLSELKQVQPFFHFRESGSNSDAKVAEAKEIANNENVAVPPFHFRCECYVDMD